MKKTGFLLGAVLLLTACEIQEKAPIDYVDPFIGTDYHGHTYPGASAPFGAVQLSPDTRRGNWDACSGYHYSDTTLLGFSHTHLSGTGCIDLGDILFRPFDGTSIPFSHADEKASPGYYRVALPTAGVSVELTTTTRVGIHRYTWDREQQPTLTVDLAHLLDNEQIHEAWIEQTAENEIRGMRRTTGWVADQHIYFTAQFSRPIQQIILRSNGEVVENTTERLTGTHLHSTLSFAPDEAPLVCKVGLSIVSAENARENLIAETDAFGFDFDAIRQQTGSLWEQALQKISIEGATEAEKRLFYTALYHCQLAPNVVSDVNRQYRRHDNTIAELPANQRQYSSFSTWDTFRAWHPLMTLFDAELVNDMVNSLQNIYDASGEMPFWPLSSGETGTMIGYHTASIITDAYMKGFRGFDANKALDALVASAEKNKKGAKEYIQYGFIPANTKKESVSCLLEYAYDDWCIAQLAQALGREDIYDTFIQRSQNYSHVFDGNTRFFRGKRQDGNWEVPFDPYAVSRAFTEATAWQYRFFVPHDMYGLEQLFGGKDLLLNALDSLFTTESTTVGDLQDLTGMMGQYAHGNEPSHHIAYLYSYLGQPEKTQYYTRRLLQEMYQATPEGIHGNEDCGQMSAWYLLSSLGFYPVCPGTNQFVLTSPLFEKATLQLQNGKQLTITCNDPKRNSYIRQVKLNGRELPNCYITWEELMEGGELQYLLVEQPDASWGKSPDSAPYSYSDEPFVSIPFIREDVNLFEEQVSVTMNSATPGTTIYYTTDGSEPNEQATRYRQPLILTETTTLKAIAYKEGMHPSRTFTITAVKAELRPSLSLSAPLPGVAYRYFEGKFSSVTELDKALLVSRGTHSHPDISLAKQEDHFGFIFTGYLFAPESGVYHFATQSDDGSILLIGDHKVVDNDGSHAAIQATGSVALQAGYHPFTLYYFEDYEGEYLSWSWKRPSSTRFERIPKEGLFQR